MSREQETLLYLIKLSIGSDVEPGFDFSGLDWNKLVDIAFDQGVAALVVDGLGSTSSPTGMVEGNLLLESEELEDLRYELFGEALACEEDYSNQWKIFLQLIQELSEHNIRVLLLKGLGLSKYYPVPSHRPTGDFDLYTYGQHLDVDSLFRKNGISIDCSYPKHSVIMYKGVMVENHYIYLDSFITRCEKKVQKFIESLDADVLNDEGYYTPSPIKNYFFLLCHTARHFSGFGSIKLRHILDWGLFLKSEAGNLDLGYVRMKLNEFGLQKTNDLFVSLAEVVCGVDFSDLLFKRLPEEECMRVLDYVMMEKKRATPQRLFPRIRYKLKLITESRWKYQYLAITLRERVWYSAKLHLAGKVEI